MTLSDILGALVAFRTTTGNYDAIRDLLTWVERELHAVPLHRRWYEPYDTPALVLTTAPTTHARLWLAAHVDVVPGGGDLFTPTTRGRKLIGRGAFDMKFAVACYLLLLREFGGDARSYDLGVMLTGDEEAGSSHDGVEYLLTHEGYTGDVAFLPDGTGSWVFEESAKGLLTIEISVRGIRSHGSRPWHGRSAIHHLTAILNDLIRYSEELGTGCDGEHWHPTLHIGTVHGGEAFNVVAPHATAILDVRYPFPRDRTTLLARIRAIVRSHRHASVRIVADERPYGILRSNGYAKLFAACAEQQGIACGWARAHGSSDARFFNAAGIPTILIAPRGGDAHADHEWVDLHDLTRYYHVLKSFVERVARRTTIH